jgi:hypothetical protein
MLQKKSLIFSRSIVSSIAGSALIVITVLFIIFLLVSPFFIKIGKAECKSQFGTCSKELDKELNNKIGKSYFIVKKEIVKYFKNNLLIKDYSVQYKLPNIIKVDLLIKKPAFCLKESSNNMYALIGDDGTIFAIQEECSLPEIDNMENMNLKVGEKIDDQKLYFLKLLRGVNQMYQTINGKIENLSLTVELPSGIKVIFPGEGDINALLGSLRLINTKIDNEGLKYSEVDLRFANPVLR